jgi:hypothetical protein
MVDFSSSAPQCGVTARVLWEYELGVVVVVFKVHQLLCSEDVCLL